MALIRGDHCLALDTNTIVRAFANWESPSGILVECCEQRVFRLLTSRQVLAEYRRVLMRPELSALHHSVEADVEKVLRRLKYVSDSKNVADTHFPFDRDPDDAKFLELAIAGKATHLVTHDRDLLSLAAAHSDAVRRFRQRAPGTRILPAAAFLAESGYDSSRRRINSGPSGE
jgi:putative PIN family toxin of toxin-antitoxin system